MTDLSVLSNIVGAANILTDAESKAIYGQDKTQIYQPNPLAIVFPTQESQVKELVLWANKTKTALVPSGGRTGYSGGAVAAQQEIVVAFDKMNKILEFNAQDQTVTCQAGVITKHLQDFAIEQELYYPVDFASSGSSQIGGNIATNAGGIKVLRYGSTRNWVSGLKVITGTGELLNLNQGLIKNNSGYDLRQLFIGSEGTLGFITEATLKLTIKPEELKVILFAVPDKAHLIELLNLSTAQLKVTAFEFFSELALQQVLDNLHLAHPLQTQAAYYALLEFETDPQSEVAALTLTNLALKQHFVTDAVISNSLQQFKNLWRFREEISMALSKFHPYKYDIAILPSKISDFMQQAERVLKDLYPNSISIWFGHIGDGNLHLNILKPAYMDATTFWADCEKKSEQVYSLVQNFAGSISAEHGIGLIKKPFLRYSKSLAELEYLRAIKEVFDPNQILNPGKIF